MTHAWCRDPSRDERVRAAEDGRTAPLPTLGEAIAAVTESMSVDARGEEMEQGNFAETAERSVPVSNKGEGQSGLRTERVTLEVTHDASRDDPRLIDAVRRIAYAAVEREFRYPGESVRVVSDEEREEFPSACPIAGGTVVVNGEDMVTLSEFLRHTTKLTQEAGVAKRERDELRKSWLRSEESGTRLLAERNAALDAADGVRKQVAELKDKSHARWVSMNKFLGELAETRRERDEAKARVAELEAASGGGEGEPDAWGVVRGGNVDSVTHRRFRGDADRVAEQWGETVVPLYRSPPQPRGWLTASDRQELEEIVVCLDDDNWQHSAAFVRSLLARSTPPKVRLPDPVGETKSHGPLLRKRDVLAALAAAGVEVVDA
jgi:hypothetical protein